MEKLTFVVPTLLGVEGLTADELRRMGMAETRAENGRVLCQGEAKDIPRLNLRLRTGERVLLLVGSFPARSFEELFQGVQALPWERWIPQGGQFPVKGYSLNSVLHSVPACQSIVKKAVATRLGRVYHRETLPEDGALYQIQFSLMKNQVSLMLDTTGPGLYKRGYRAVGVEAPLRETLAAALVLLSGYRGKDPFCDPFCGSGTIAIEAALIAKNRAPGLNRTFSAQKWDWLPSQTWVDGAGEAMDLEYDGTYDIWGGDIDPAAVHLAQANAVKADVEDLVHFTQGTPVPSPGRNHTAELSVILPMVSACWISRWQRNSTEILAGQSEDCQKDGGFLSFLPIRHLNEPLGHLPTKNENSTTECCSATSINTGKNQVFRPNQKQTNGFQKNAQKRRGIPFPFQKFQCCGIGKGRVL